MLSAKELTRLTSGEPTVIKPGAFPRAARCFPQWGNTAKEPTKNAKGVFGGSSRRKAAARGKASGFITVGSLLEGGGAEGTIGFVAVGFLLVSGGAEGTIGFIVVSSLLTGSGKGELPVLSQLVLFLQAAVNRNYLQKSL